MCFGLKALSAVQKLVAKLLEPLPINLVLKSVAMCIYNLSEEQQTGIFKQFLLQKVHYSKPITSN